MSTLCSRPYTLNVISLSDDMPITSAIYLPSAGKIYGVRSGYLFEFDATTGNSTGRSLNYADALPGFAQLAISPLDGSLWCGHSPDAHLFERISQQGFYRFNPTTMATAQFVPYDTSFNFDNSIPQTDPTAQTGYYNSGPTAFQFTPNGRALCLAMSRGGDELSLNLINAAFNSVSNWKGSSTNGYPPNANAFYWDDSANTLWLAGFQTAMASAVTSGSSFNVTTYDYGSSAFAFYGFDYVPSVDSFFIATRTPNLMLMNRTTQAFTLIDLSLSRPNMKPRLARFLSRKSRIYLPTMIDNAVVEVNTAGTVTNVFTGFDCPWDVFDTGSKVFAVQLGKAGLKQVTT